GRRESHFGPFDAEPFLAFETEWRELSLGKLAEIGACPILGEQKIMCLRQRLKPSAKGFDEGFGRGRRAERLLGQGKDDGEGVVDAVSELAEQQRLLLLCRLPLADVDQHVHGADQLAYFFVQRSGKRDDGNARAIGTLDNLLGSAHRLVSLEGECRGTFLLRDGLPVRPIKLAANRPSIVAEERPPAAELGGGHG